MDDFLSNSEEEAKEYLPRYKILYATIFCAAALILGRLWYLQIIAGTELRQFSEKNRVKETKLPAPRGLFLDRENRVLVDNLPGFDVTIAPQYATKLQETAEAVGQILGIEPVRIVSDVRKSRRRDGPFRPVKVKDNASMDEVFRLKMLRWDHPGLNVVESIVRFYNLKENAAQLFGYVGEISKEQIPLYNARYKGHVLFEQGDIVGKSGLEEMWDVQIRGKDGMSYVEVDARGREAPSENPIYFGFQPQQAIPGHNLVLTIDKDLQEAAYNAMKRKDSIGNRIGGVVLLKSDGEILAWVDTPSFDPNVISAGPSQELSTVWSSLVNDPFKPFRNKVIQDPISPGSTFKPFVALAALQEKVITPHTLVFSPGQLKFGRRIYHDHEQGGYGSIDVMTAIQHSSNVFFFKMGIALGIDKIAAYAKLLGLGSKTGIQIAHEASGLIPSSEWKLKNFGEEWQPGENLSNAIGQGFVLTTAMQLAVGYNTIAREGEVVRPFLVKKIIDQDNKVIREFLPEIVRDATKDNGGIHIDRENFKVVKEGLRRVVEAGTGRSVRLPGIAVGGKTGTVQVRSQSAEDIHKRCEGRPLLLRDHGWFVGIAPVDKPEVTVAVLAEHSCWGAEGAAPVAHDVLLAYFQKYHPEMLKGDAKQLQTRVVSPPHEHENEDEVFE
jgi:penicillin-binding protein 2